jgi:hypothetical protein
MPMPRGKRRAYPSDLTNSQWAMMSRCSLTRCRAAKREIVEAIAVSATRGLFMAVSAA